jgi:hypothetical protein
MNNQNRDLRLHSISFLLLITALSDVVAMPAIIESPETRVSLLELYTSEGCSSCPPADRWFSTLKDDKRLWTSLVPVAFHVDYWNYIGWEDRFSAPAHSDRQRQYARSNNIRTVYTPGIVLNGDEWRSYFGLRKLSLENNKNVGKIVLSVDGSRVNAIFKPVSSLADDLVLNLALLGFNLVTEVKAGENRGHKLEHNFVVLGFRTTPLVSSSKGFTASTDLPTSKANASRMAIAAWISRIGDQTPIQSVGGWLAN